LARAMVVARETKEDLRSNMLTHSNKALMYIKRTPALHIKTSDKFMTDMVNTLKKQASNEGGAGATDLTLYSNGNPSAVIYYQAAMLQRVRERLLTDSMKTEVDRVIRYLSHAGEEKARSENAEHNPAGQYDADVAQKAIQEDDRLQTENRHVSEDIEAGQDEYSKLLKELAQIEAELEALGETEPPVWQLQKKDADSLVSMHADAAKGRLTVREGESWRVPTAAKVVLEAAKKEAEKIGGCVAFVQNPAEGVDFYSMEALDDSGDFAVETPWKAYVRRSGSGHPVAVQVKLGKGGWVKASAGGKGKIDVDADVKAGVDVDVDVEVEMPSVEVEVEMPSVELDISAGFSL